MRGEHPDFKTIGGRQSHTVPDQNIKVFGIGWVQGRTEEHPVGGPEEFQSWGSRNWHILESQGIISGQEIDLIPPYHEGQQSGAATRQTGCSRRDETRNQENQRTSPFTRLRSAYCLASRNPLHIAHRRQLACGFQHALPSRHPGTALERIGRGHDRIVAQGIDGGCRHHRPGDRFRHISESGLDNRR